MGGLLKKHPLASYFFLAFLLMWGLSSLGIFRVLRNITDYPYLYVLGSWTPTIAAVVVCLIAYGSRTTAYILKGWLIWRVSIWYYMVALLPLFLMFVFGILYSIATAKPAISIAPRFTVASIVELLVFSMILGPMGEGAGWWGFALRFLQKRHSAVVAFLVLGIIWSVWHLPMWFVEGFEESQIPFWLFTVDHVFRTILLVWVFNSTRGSLLLIGLLHLTQNVAMYVVIVLFERIPVATGYVSMVAMYFALAAIILILWGNKNLSVNGEKEQCVPKYSEIGTS